MEKKVYEFISDVPILANHVMLEVVTVEERLQVIRCVLKEKYEEEEGK